MRAPIDQPRIRREYRSITTARQSHPSSVPMKPISPTHT